MSSASAFGCLLVMLAWGCGSGDHVQGVAPVPSNPLVEFNPDVNQCPSIHGAVVIPLEIPPLVLAQVAAYAVDPDAAESQLVYAWTAESGTFVDSGKAVTEYQCTELGPQILSVSVRDVSGCSGHLTVQVDCIAAR